MQRVVGIGGVFFRARDPEALRRWYGEHLGMVVEDFGDTTFVRGKPLRVWQPPS
jgi:catechol 2,3-dioxygenase-like lactoylglutathione lyase family enzyme